LPVLRTISRYKLQLGSGCRLGCCSSMQFIANYTVKLWNIEEQKQDLTAFEIKYM
jgi:hypothetical protein